MATGADELQDLAAKAVEVAVAAGADDAEAAAQDSVGREIRVFDGHVESLAEAGERGLGVRSWIDGRAVLSDCVGAFSEQASAGGVALASSASPDGLKLFADERAFRQIVGNLLSNAVKFTPPAGKIMVRLALVDDGAMLSIRDTGCGIPADQLPGIFQPFEQSAKGYGHAKGGTGLGLALVRSLTELHGGTCRIDSEVDMGTLVTVFIPWPRVPNVGLGVVLTLAKMAVVLALVGVADVVNPRLRIDQSMAYYARIIVYVALGALVFAVLGA